MSSLAARSASFYGTVTLYPIDVNSLEPRQWVRSGVIAYFFAQLQHSADPADGTRFLDPAVIQAMYQFRSAACGPVTELREARNILMVLNDFDNATCVGAGDHWSLLIIVCNDPRAFHGIHLDSYHQKNEKIARQVFKFIETVATDIWGPEEHRPWEFHTPSHQPTQTNGYDCGLFVMLHAQHCVMLAKRCIMSSIPLSQVFLNVNDSGGELFEGVTPAAASELRKALLTQIQSQMAST